MRKRNFNQQQTNKPRSSSNNTVLPFDLDGDNKVEKKAERIAFVFVFDFNASEKSNRSVSDIFYFDSCLMF